MAGWNDGGVESGGEKLSDDEVDLSEACARENERPRS